MRSHQYDGGKILHYQPIFNHCKIKEPMNDKVKEAKGWEAKYLKPEPEITSDVVKYFNKRVNKTDDCWNWVGSTNSRGYGVAYIKDSQYRAHRVSYLIFNGPTNNLHVCHSCDNRKCVNPKHLFLGTNIDNIKDRDCKGRNMRGESHTSARLKEEQVIAIIKSSLDSKILAKKYGISSRSINHIRTGETWKHIKRSV